MIETFINPISPINIDISIRGMNMVAVRKIICEREQLVDTLNRLIFKEGYRKIKVCLNGSDEHQKAGLKPDKILIKAWMKR